MGNVVDVAVEPGVKVLGENVALEGDGNPDAKNETVFAKPPAPGRFPLSPLLATLSKIGWGG
jgi:hypothetical protein